MTLLDQSFNMVMELLVILKDDSFLNGLFNCVVILCDGRGYFSKPRTDSTDRVQIFNQIKCFLSFDCGRLFPSPFRFTANPTVESMIDLGVTFQPSPGVGDCMCFMIQCRYGLDVHPV